MSDLARRYDAEHPGVGIETAQKEERQERREFHRERASLRRTGRSRGIVVPDLPWLRKEQANA
jgi:hypothetical protein